MPTLKEPQSVKLVVALLGANPDGLERGLALLCREFGATDAVSDSFPFDHTRYYEKELGPTPVRRLAAFTELIPRTALPDLKNRARELEQSLSESGRRSVNLDPGYLTTGQFFLASTKDQRQSVYVRDGIYVEPTLYYRDGNFHPFEWTYPDYASGAYFGFLEKTRSTYLRQLRENTQ